MKLKGIPVDLNHNSHRKVIKSPFEYVGSRDAIGMELYIVVGPAYGGNEQENNSPGREKRNAVRIF